MGHAALAGLRSRPPATTHLKYFHEFAAENRLEGDAGFITFTMPLSIAGH